MTLEPITIELPTHPLGNDADLVYAKDTLEIKPYVTPLVGCNGSGKSTLIGIIAERYRYADDVRLIEHDVRRATRDLVDCGVAGLFGATTEDAAIVMGSSEGEGLNYALGPLMRKLGAAIADKDDTRDIWLTIDCADSGLDALNLAELLDTLDLATGHARERGVRLFTLVAGNAYELARDRRCLVMPTLEYTTFDDYDDWRGCIKRTRELRDRQMEAWKKRRQRSRRRTEGRT